MSLRIGACTRRSSTMERRTGHEPDRFSPALPATAGHGRARGRSGRRSAAWGPTPTTTSTATTIPSASRAISTISSASWAASGTPRSGPRRATGRADAWPSPLLRPSPTVGARRPALLTRAATATPVATRWPLPLLDTPSPAPPPVRAGLVTKKCLPRPHHLRRYRGVLQGPRARLDGAAGRPRNEPVSHCAGGRTGCPSRAPPGAGSRRGF